MSDNMRSACTYQWHTALLLPQFTYGILLDFKLRLSGVGTGLRYCGSELANIPIENMLLIRTDLNCSNGQKNIEIHIGCIADFLTENPFMASENYYLIKISIPDIRNYANFWSQMATKPLIEVALNHKTSCSCLCPIHFNGLGKGNCKTFCVKPRMKI